jgi:hypothetical protein
MSTAMFFRHSWIRLRALATSPGAIFMLVVAGWSSLLLWPWMFRPALPYAPAGIDLVVHLVFLFVWPMMIAFGTIGATAVGTVKSAVGIHALPALPIGRRSRALGDALVSLLLAVLLRLVGAELSLAWFGLREPVTGEPIGWWEFGTETAIGALVMLPGVLAWVSTRRLDRTLLVKPLVVAAITFAALQLGLIAIPVVGPLFCLALAAAVLLMPELDLRLPAGLTAPGLFRRPLRRAGLDPEVRFRRDVWQGPLRRWGSMIAGFAAVALAVVLLDYFEVVPEDSGDLYYGLVFGLSFSMVGMVVLFPLGVQLFQTDRMGGNGSMMNGGFCAAWSTLPVRRLSVIRAVYLHGLASGLCWFLFLGGVIFLSNLLDLMSLRMLRFFMPMMLAIPAVAGVLTCTAVGDKARGLIAFLAVLLIIPAHIGAEMATRWGGLLHGSSSALAVNVTVLALLGAIGGLPPLVHLRRPRSERHV